LRNVFCVYTSHEGEVVRRKGVALPDLLEGDKPSGGHWVLQVAISPFVFEILAKEIDYVLLLLFQKR